MRSCHVAAHAPGCLDLLALETGCGALCPLGAAMLVVATFLAYPDPQRLVQGGQIAVAALGRARCRQHQSNFHHFLLPLPRVLQLLRLSQCNERHLIAYSPFCR